MYEAYFDRTTDNDQAVLLVEHLQKEYHVSLSSLPSGSTPGNWFQVQIDNGTIRSIQANEKKTKEMQDAIQSRLTRLQSNKKSRFKRR